MLMMISLVSPFKESEISDRVWVKTSLVFSKTLNENLNIAWYILTLFARSSRCRLRRFDSIYWPITSFSNSLAIIEPNEMKAYHLNHIITFQWLKKNVLFKKTRLMPVIRCSLFTAIDIFLRFCETQTSNDDTISHIQLSTPRKYSETGFDYNWHEKDGLIHVLKSYRNGQGLESLIRQ